jgi:cell division protein FtsI/penicillin-binding protein 2
MRIYQQSDTKPYPPGSIFKIIVAAAALESGRLYQRITCFNAKDMKKSNGVTINGSKEEGHGEYQLSRRFCQIM